MCWLAHKRTLPLKAGPGSFKRLLGSCTSTPYTSIGIGSGPAAPISVKDLHPRHTGARHQELHVAPRPLRIVAHESRAEFCGPWIEHLMQERNDARRIERCLVDQVTTGVRKLKH